MSVTKGGCAVINGTDCVWNLIINCDNNIAVPDSSLINTVYYLNGISATGCISVVQWSLHLDFNREYWSSIITKAFPKTIISRMPKLVVQKFWITICGFMLILMNHRTSEFNYHDIHLIIAMIHQGHLLISLKLLNAWVCINSKYIPEEKMWPRNIFQRECYSCPFTTSIDVFI